MDNNKLTQGVAEIKFLAGVSSDGSWAVCGWPGAPEEHLNELVVESLGENKVYKLYTVCVRLPIPAEAELVEVQADQIEEVE